MTISLQKNRFITNLEKMDAKTVVLLGRESLFGSSVEILLSVEKIWQIVRISNDQSFNKLLRNVKAAKPNVVILYQAQHTGDTRLLARLLRDCPGLKVITVNPDDNVMEVYTKQTVWLREVNDLLATVEN